MQYSYSGLQTGIGIGAHKRNDFHLRGTISMVTKWRIFWFQTEKEKKYENIKRNSKEKYGRLSRYRLLVFANPVIFFVLSRQSSNVYSWLPARNGELLLCWQPSFSREKRWERCETRRGIVCCAFRRSWGGTSTKASAEDCFPGCSRRQGKKRKRRCSSIKKKRSRPTCLYLYFDELSASRLR